ncbi:hypothetical protein PoB_003135700 [Plakobranchus ocellatus]|uniref:Uncharacterized protein n=1 Tax=Plakobranchus ocellatus TaxID=259542 RepID=A0AAV4AC56_9GAST|nr:hypothetical protein PoB_003135700 [Plakobranchus ocellatus]
MENTEYCQISNNSCLDNNYDNTKGIKVRKLRGVPAAGNRKMVQKSTQVSEGSIIQKRRQKEMIPKLAFLSPSFTNMTLSDCRNNEEIASKEKEAVTHVYPALSSRRQWQQYKEKVQCLCHTALTKGSDNFNDTSESKKRPSSPRSSPNPTDRNIPQQSIHSRAREKTTNLNSFAINNGPDKRKLLNAKDAKRALALVHPAINSKKVVGTTSILAKTSELKRSSDNNVRPDSSQYKTNRIVELKRKPCHEFYFLKEHLDRLNEVSSSKSQVIMTKHRPRSRQTLLYGRSRNARHHRSRSTMYKAQEPVATFILNDEGSRFRSDLTTPIATQSKMMFSTLSSPYKAVADINARDMVSNAYKDTTGNTKSPDAMNKDIHKMSGALIASDCGDGCRKDKCVFSTPHSTVQTNIFKQKESRISGDSKGVDQFAMNNQYPKTIHYHSHLKPETKDEALLRTNQRADMAKEENGHLSRQEFFSKWKKCLTVDTENNIKSMVSLCEDKNGPGVESHLISHTMNEVLFPDYFSKSKSGKANKRDIETAFPNKSVEFREWPDHSETRDAAEFTPFKKRRRKNPAPHPSRSAILYSPKQRHGCPSISSIAPHNIDDTLEHSESESTTEDLQESKVNMDFLEAPAVCPVRRLPRLQIDTPPKVSLGSCQLVSLYKIALKKVGVGYRLSPVDPEETNFKVMPSNWENHSVTSQAIPYQINHQGYGAGSPPFIKARTRLRSKPCKENAQRLNPSSNCYNRQMAENFTKISSHHNSDGPKARDLGRFCNESLYALSSASLSCESCASCGHLNRRDYLSSSPTPFCSQKVKKSAESAIQQSGSMLQSASKSRFANYYFTSFSPEKNSKLNEGNEKKSSQRAVKQKQTSKGLEKQLTRQQLNKSTGTIGDRRKKMPSSSKTPPFALAKSKKSIAAFKSPQKQQKDFKTTKLTVSPDIKETKQNMKISKQDHQNKEHADNKHVTYDTTLNRVASDPQKLTNTLNSNTSSYRRNIGNQTKTKSNLKGFSYKPSLKPKLKEKSKVCGQQSEIITPSAYQCAQNSSKNPAPTLSATSNNNRLIQSKHLPPTVARACYKKTLAPVDIAKNTETTLARKLSTPLLAGTMSSAEIDKKDDGIPKPSQTAGSRASGAPQLRTAARAAAKTLMLAPRTPKNSKRERIEKNRPGRKPKDKTSKTNSTPHNTCQELSEVQKTIAKCISFRNTKRQFSVGTQWPSSQQAERPLKSKLCSTTGKRSPKNTKVDYNNDAQVRVSQGRECTPKFCKRHKMVSPIHQTLGSPLKYSEQNRKSCIGPKYTDRATESSFTWSVSVDTSWDVSASQVFD